nr:hypothetical protein GCM10020185_52720 [Pseudomonas brassicacearum subsp. brassicacearum]
MSFIKTAVVAVALSTGLLVSGLAQAHPKLLSSTPAEGAEGAAPAKIELHFFPKNLMTKFFRCQADDDRDARHGGAFAHAYASQGLRQR